MNFSISDIGRVFPTSFDSAFSLDSNDQSEIEYINFLIKHPWNLIGKNDFINHPWAIFLLNDRGFKQYIPIVIKFSFLDFSETEEIILNVTSTFEIQNLPIFVLGFKKRFSEFDEVQLSFIKIWLTWLSISCNIRISESAKIALRQMTILDAYE
jgi:hypothetical protein